MLRKIIVTLVKMALSANDDLSRVKAESERRGPWRIGVGLVFVTAVLALIVWNEWSTVHRLWDMGKIHVKNVQSDRVLRENEGQLVHLIGRVTTAETLTDPQTGVEARAIKLEREVEMYQWKEEAQFDTRYDSYKGRWKQVVTGYVYRKVWDDMMIDSSHFHEQEDHRNPGPIPINGWRVFVAEEATLGAFRLAPSLIDQIGCAKPLTIPASQWSEPIRIEGNEVRLGLGSSRSRIGDLRMRYIHVPLQTISLIARQGNDDLLTPSPSTSGKIALIECGPVEVDTMLDRAKDKRAQLATLFRVLLLVLLAAGLRLSLAARTTLAALIQPLGQLETVRPAASALLQLAVLSMAAIGAVWIHLRPEIGLLLLALAVGTPVYVWLALRRLSLAAATVVVMVIAGLVLYDLPIGGLLFGGFVLHTSLTRVIKGAPASEFWAHPPGRRRTGPPRPRD